jgi:hypothetical protein
MKMQSIAHGARQVQNGKSVQKTEGKTRSTGHKTAGRQHDPMMIKQTSKSSSKSQKTCQEDRGRRNPRL